MAEEATIQGVVSELQVINQLIHDTTDLHLEGLIAIESAAKAIDLKVGRMLEQPAIQESLEKFSQDIVEGITGSFDAALEYQKQRDKEQDREEKGEIQGGEKKGFGESVKDSFKAGLQSGPKMPKALGGLGSTIKDIAEISGELAAAGVLTREFLKGGGITKPLQALKGFFANLGSRIFIFLSGFQNFQFFESLKSLTKTLGKFVIPITVVIGTIEGIIEAFNYFNQAGEGVQSKFMAGIEGFFAGFIGTLLAPIDWIVNGIGDFFGIEWMQKLSLVEDMKLGVEVFFNLLEDMGQLFGELYDSVAESAFGQALKDIWEKITGAFDSFLQGMIDAYNKIAQYVPGLPMIGEDTREKGKTSEDYKMEKKEAREAIRAARDSGLYDRNIIGTSEIDREMVKDAPTNQLWGILNEGDLSDDDHMFVYDEIQSREKRKAAFDTKMGTSNVAPPTPEVVNNTTNTSSVLQEVTVPTREVKTIPSAMSREPKVEKTGYELAQENPNVMVMPSSGKFRATNPEMPLETGTKFFDTYEEAAAWASKDPTKRGMEIGGPDVVQKGTINGTAVLSGKPTVTGGLQTNAAQSAELEARSNDLATTQAQNTTNNAAPVVVSDNSQQQSIVQNNVTSGVNPSPFDRSDRTHRRGAYRGT